LDAFLDAWIAKNLGAGWEGSLRKFLRSRAGPLPVLLVDGWDELGPLGQEFRDALFGFLREYNHVLVVVTSRPYGEHRPTRSEGFEWLDIQPLSPAEIDAFAARFFGVCYPNDAVSAQQEAQRFRAALNRSPEAAALAQTALLLTMMLLISRSEQLPDKRHLLYGKCIDNLLTSLPARREEGGVLLPTNHWRPEDSELRRQAIAALAHAIQLQGYEGRARSAIVVTWAEMSKLLPESWANGEREGFLSWLAEAAGLLTDGADGTLVFAHLSFQEYLTAWHLNANVVDSQQMAERFLHLAAHGSRWWETLLLWGAMVSGQSPERLSAVIERLLRKESAPALAGMMLADGLGVPRSFEQWAGTWVALFLDDLPPGRAICRRAWAASRQDDRKRRLRELFCEAASTAGLGGRLRLEDFWPAVSSERDHLPAPATPASQHALAALSEVEDWSGEEVAAGRIFCGGPPIWPDPPAEIGLLQLWPSRRRLLGLRLQLAAVCGATRSEIASALATELRSPPMLEVKTNWRRQFNHELQDRIFKKVSDHAVRDLIRDLAHTQAFDCAGDVLRFRDRVKGRLLAQHFRAYVRRGKRGDMNAKSHAKKWARMIAGVEVKRELCQAWTRRWSLAGNTPWLKDFARYDLRSTGRSVARATVATYWQAGFDMVPLLTAACRLSLNPGGKSQSFADAVASLECQVDSLWPALARHLARQSSMDDRALLIDLAQHPERREPPFCWGLQYIVRGDLLLAEGEVVTLDALCDELGLPHLPYLEELADEVDI
jgi:hypothetical protein